MTKSLQITVLGIFALMLFIPGLYVGNIVVNKIGWDSNTTSYDYISTQPYQGIGVFLMICGFFSGAAAFGIYSQKSRPSSSSTYSEREGYNQHLRDYSNDGGSWNSQPNSFDRKLENDMRDQDFNRNREWNDRQQQE